MSHRKYTICAILLAVLLEVPSCGGILLNWEIGGTDAVSCRSETVTDRELRLLTLHYKAEFEGYYRSLLGNSFWDTEVRDGVTYEAYVREYYVLAEAKALVVLNAMYRKDGDPLTRAEEAGIRAEAERIYASMTTEERLYTEASFEDILSLKRACYTAGKMIDLLLEGRKIEVSDEQSRVADIQVIRMGSLEEAEAVYARLQAGENYLSLAEECSLDDVISYSVRKDTLADPLNQAVFSMSAGTTSGILEAAGYYYIIRLTSSYNKLLSMNNKANQLAEARYEGWKTVYDAYTAENPVYVNTGCDRIIDLRNDTFTTSFNLFPASAS